MKPFSSNSAIVTYPTAKLFPLENKSVFSYSIEALKVDTSKLISAWSAR